MKTVARFERKENELDTQPCVIDAIHEIPADEYNAFTKNMLRDYEFIRNNQDMMCVDSNGLTHCMLVMGTDLPDGVLINSEGSSYGRYTAILPNAREFVNGRIREMADEIIKEGTSQTENGVWVVDWDEISRRFGSAVTSNNGVGELLYTELLERGEVDQCIATEDDIEMIYHLEHCPRCQSGGIDGFMSLFSLMGCNLEDVHLFHADEDHDLATVVELNQNTLTEQGKQDWSDVLSAKVERIYTGYYGLQIGLSGCDADRLRDFSFMLAGQCSCKDYDKWVRQDETEQAQSDSHAGMEM